ncbi:MAG: hypothetical protein Q8Q36_00925 [bacterium]|nr:hypothetical protein [bacterium]
MDPHTLATRCLDSLPRGSVVEQLRHLRICRIGLSEFAPPPHFLLYADKEKDSLKILLSVKETEGERMLNAAVAIAHAFSLLPGKIPPFYAFETKMKQWAVAQGLPELGIGEFCSSFGGQWLGQHVAEFRELLPKEPERPFELPPQ